MPHKILVVDDDRINLALVKFALSEQYYDVALAYDGRDGIKKFKEISPDLIVLDVMMPNMNGYEFMAELKSLQGVDTTPVIMLTANESMEGMFKLEGVKEYFVKPVNLPKLVSRIKECLGENPI